MTGNELARAILKAKGPINIPMLFPTDVYLVKAVKEDVVTVARGYGNEETGMELVTDQEIHYLRRAP